MYKNTSSNSQILIELDRPVLSCISYTKLLPVWNKLGTIKGLFLGLIKEASNKVAVYRRLGYFTCQSHDLYSEAGVYINELESETEHIL